MANDKDADSLSRALLTVRLFYLLLFFLWLLRAIGLLQNPEVFVAPARPLEILSWIPSDLFSVFAHGVNWLGAAVICGCGLVPSRRGLRIAASVALLFAVGIDSSYGKVIHGYYGMLYASLALIFLPTQRDADYETNVENVLFYAKFSSVMCYAMAGLWKIRSIPLRFGADGSGGLLSALGNTIAYEHILHSYQVTPVTQFFLDHDPLTAVLFFGLVGLQTLSPVLIMRRQLHLLFGILIVLFHTLSEWIVRIPFRPQLFLMLLFFVWPSLDHLIRSRFLNRAR